MPQIPAIKEAKIERISHLSKDPWQKVSSTQSQPVIRLWSQIQGGIGRRTMAQGLPGTRMQDLIQKITKVGEDRRG
jgi:hypothetical protein